MYLHENQEDWSELVARTANRFYLAESFVIKDYFIYLALKSIARTDPEIVFKGGTCLSNAIVPSHDSRRTSTLASRSSMRRKDNASA